MQIIKPPLGIKAPLLGLGVPLTLPRSLLQNKSNLQPLLHRLSNSLNSSQELGLSQLSSSKYSEFLPALANRSLRGWNADNPHVEIETSELIQNQEDSIYNNEKTSNIKGSLPDKIATDILSQRSGEKIQKKAKSKNSTKSHKKQTKSRSRSKKAVAPATLEKLHQSFNEINTESSVNGDGWVAASEPLPVESSSEVLGLNRSPNASYDPLPIQGDKPNVFRRLKENAKAAAAEPEPAMPSLEASAVNATDVLISLHALQPGITLENTTADEFSDSAPVLEHFPSESEDDKPTVLRRRADDPQVAAAAEPAVPNLEASAVNTTDVQSSLHAPQLDITLENTTASNFLDNASVLEHSSTESEADNPSVLRRKAADTQTVAAQPLPTVPNPKVLDANGDNVTDAHRPSAPQQDVDLDSITSESSGSLPILETINKSPTGDNFTLFRNLEDGEQPAITEPPPAVPISIPDRDSYRTAAATIDIIPHLHMGAVIDDSLAAGGDLAQREKDDKLPPPKGFAVGGQVTGSDTISNQQVAPSDTVPAMLTPGEFVINAIDTQKNLNLLKHVNSGGTVTENLISTSVQDISSSSKPKEAALTETPTKVDSFAGVSVQRKGTDLELPAAWDSLAPASQGLGTGVQSLSTFSPLQSNSFKTQTPRVEQRSAHYPSAPLIFPKRTPGADSPSQWSSVEDLFSRDKDTASPDEFGSLNFGSVTTKHWNSEASVVSESRGNFVSRMPAPRGFAAGGEVTAPNISTFVQPYTKTIESPALAPNTDDTDSADLEALAREIYNRLRQRLEVERERHGIYSGRLPW